MVTPLALKKSAVPEVNIRNQVLALRNAKPMLPPRVNPRLERTLADAKNSSFASMPPNDRKMLFFGILSPEA